MYKPNWEGFNSQIKKKQKPQWRRMSNGESEVQNTCFSKKKKVQNTRKSAKYTNVFNSNSCKSLNQLHIFVRSYTAVTFIFYSAIYMSGYLVLSSSTDLPYLKKLKRIFMIFKKYWKKGCSNGVSDNHAKYQVQIYYILGYTEMTTMWIWFCIFWISISYLIFHLYVA